MMSLDFFPCKIPIPYDALYVYDACNVLVKYYSKSVVVLYLWNRPQDMGITQSQKTTEYSREPKQKQANGAHKWQNSLCTKDELKQQEQN